MSRVTNVIITGSAAEDKREVAQLNAACQRWNEGVQFSEVASANVAGTKNLECCVLLGAFNYLDLIVLCASMKRVKWQYPESVQLFVMEQEAEQFVEIKWRES